MVLWLWILSCVFSFSLWMGLFILSSILQKQTNNKIIVPCRSSDECFLSSARPRWTNLTLKARAVTTQTLLFDQAGGWGLVFGEWGLPSLGVLFFSSVTCKHFRGCLGAYCVEKVIFSRSVSCRWLDVAGFNVLLLGECWGRVWGVL